MGRLGTGPWDRNHRDPFIAVGGGFGLRRVKYLGSAHVLPGYYRVTEQRLNAHHANLRLPFGSRSKGRSWEECWVWGKL